MREYYPTITYFFSFLNIAIYTITSYPLLVEYGLSRETVISKPYQLVTYSFLHASPIHLIVNMIFLLIFGSIMEKRHGPILFTTTYTLSAIVGGLAHIYVSENGILVGSSGAVSGIIGFLLVSSPGRKVKGPAFIGFVAIYEEMPVYAFAAIWMIAQAAVVFYTASNVAVWTHISGFVTGALIGLAVKLRRNPWKRVQYMNKLMV